MIRTPKEAERQIDSVARALQILDCFSTYNPELYLRQLSEITGLFKSRILRLCGTLTAHGYLIRTEVGSYKIGPKLMVLGNAYEKSNPLISLGHPILRDLSTQLGESSSLYVMEGTKRLCLSEEQGTLPIRYAISEEKALLELYAGAAGKVLLAFCQEELLDNILSSIKLKKITKATITNKKRLQFELRKIRKNGYAVSVGERIPDVAALAVPVFDLTKNICASISINMPIQRFSNENCRKHIEALKKAAHKLSNLLGYTE